LRTRRAHPSEKTAFRLISGLSPQGHLALDGPPRGGAGSARPDRRLELDPGHVPIRPPGVPLPPMIMLCLGSFAASECGRTECVPPRKPPSAASRGFPRKAIRSGLTPRGGAGSARPDRRLGLDPGHVPIRPPGVPLPPMIMLCLGSLAASECGRTECVPPRKPPSAASRAFPRKAILPWMAHPAEGRAPHACKENSPSTRGSPLGPRLPRSNGDPFFEKKNLREDGPKLCWARILLSITSQSPGPIVRGDLGRRV